MIEVATPRLFKSPVLDPHVEGIRRKPSPECEDGIRVWLAPRELDELLDTVAERGTVERAHAGEGPEGQPGTVTVLCRPGGRPVSPTGERRHRARAGAPAPVNERNATALGA